jgi:hypothetical protein
MTWSGTTWLTAGFDAREAASLGETVADTAFRTV